MRASLYEIIKEAASQPTNQEKAAILLKNDCIPLRTILHHTFNHNVKFLLPEGEPPYKSFPLDDVEGRLYSEMRRVYLFTEGGHPNLNQNRREQLFIQMLESVSPMDAKLLIGMKDHKLPEELRSVTPEVFELAWPGILPTA